MEQRMTDQDWWVELGKMPDEAGEFHWQDRPSTAPWTSCYIPAEMYG